MDDVSKITHACRNRDFDILVHLGLNDDSLVLKAHFDGYGDYFSVHCTDVEYVRTSMSLTLGGMVVDDFSIVSKLDSTWMPLARVFGRMGIAMWTVDSESFELTPPSDRYLIVASDIYIVRGKDWDAIEDLSE